MLKIRLRRMGAIRQPSYRIVVADARSPRDGRFVEIIGHYNPLTDPATIQIDLEKFEDWKKKGAQPTDAVASLARQFARRQRQQVEVNPQTRAATKKGVVAPPQAAKAEVEAQATAEEPVVTPPAPEEAQPEVASAEAETPNPEAAQETGA